jgi:hypothetical protein
MKNNVFIYLESVKDSTACKSLKAICVGEPITPLEAFELGIQLQHVLDIEQETSSTGLDEGILAELISDVKEFLKDIK